MKRCVYAFLFLNLALFGSLSGCGAEPAVEEGAYVTAVAERGDVRDAVPATGTLSAHDYAEIRANQSGVISEVYVQEGQAVHRGQVFARLDAPRTAPARDEAVASSAASLAAVDEAQINLRAAEADRDRRRTLVDGGFVSPAALALADTKVEQARAAVARAQADARAAGARIRQSSAVANDALIRAPIAGTVVFSSARPGLRVSPDDERPLFQTSNGTAQMTLEIMIPEPDMSRVAKDSRVIFTVDAYPRIRNEATLLSIGEAPLREGRFVSYRALARVENQGGQLLPGMSASVELIKADSRNVLRIPARALYFRPHEYLPPLSSEELEKQRRRYSNDMGMVRAATSGAEFGRLLRQGKRLIFSIKDGQLHRHEIRIGAETDEFVEVVDGLDAGAVVVVSHRDRQTGLQ